MSPKRKHELAREHIDDAQAALDDGPLLRTLNQARKDIWYDGEEPELDDELESVAARVEELVNAAEAPG